MKVCSSCKERKPRSAFNKHSSRKDGLQSNCRECNKSRSKQYYLDNKEKHTQVTGEKHQSYTKRNRQLIFDYLSSHPCVDCGITDIRVLEFDHVTGDKVMGVGKLARHAASVETIMAEIDKCEVRCRNCHQIVTYVRMGGSWHDLLIELT